MDLNKLKTLFYRLYEREYELTMYNSRDQFNISQDIVDYKEILETEIKDIKQQIEELCL
jgi:hypothetical protein